MKAYILFLAFSFCISCKNNQNTKSLSNTDSTAITPHVQDTIIDTAHKNIIAKETEEFLIAEQVSPIPPSGQYRYDMAFAEFQGQTMGEKVTVIINGDSITIVYEGDGKLTTPKGTILDQGIIVKHKSGVYIIAHDKKDAMSDVYGGCSGGPAVIDFANKKYMSC